MTMPADLLLEHGAKVQALPVAGLVRWVRVAADVKPDGTLGIQWTADHSGGYHGIELFGLGVYGAVRPLAFLSARDARSLAVGLLLEADRLERAGAR